MVETPNSTIFCYVKLLTKCRTQLRKQTITVARVTIHVSYTEFTKQVTSEFLFKTYQCLNQNINMHIQMTSEYEHLRSLLVDKALTFTPDKLKKSEIKLPLSHKQSEYLSLIIEPKCLKSTQNTAHP